MSMPEECWPICFDCLCGQHLTVCSCEEPPAVCLTCGQEILSVEIGTYGERDVQLITYQNTFRRIETYTDGDITYRFIGRPDTEGRIDQAHDAIADMYIEMFMNVEAAGALDVFCTLSTEERRAVLEKGRRTRKEHAD
jgi:hypothetical protein